MPLPTISVIMPVYNAALYVGEAIESILSQTFTDFEFIIIDDGSTDDSLTIIETYTDKRIKLLRQTENKGIAQSSNHGLNICQGEFIARMDADDISVPERFEIQVNYLRKNPAVGISCGLMAFFGQRSGTSDIQIIPFQKMNLSLFFSCEVYQPTVMVRSELLQKFKLKYDERFITAEDWALWLDCVNKDIVIHRLVSVLVKYRVHGQNISLTDQAQHRKRTRVLMRKLLGILFEVVNEEMIELHYELVFGSKPNQSNKAILRHSQALLTALVNFGFGKEQVAKQIHHTIQQYAFRLADIAPVKAFMLAAKTKVLSTQLTRYIAIKILKKTS